MDGMIGGGVATRVSDGTAYEAAVNLSLVPTVPPAWDWRRL